MGERRGPSSILSPSLAQLGLAHIKHLTKASWMSGWMDPALPRAEEGVEGPQLCPAVAKIGTGMSSAALPARPPASHTAQGLGPAQASGVIQSLPK